MRIRVSILAVIACVGASMAAPVFAQTTGARVGFVNVARLLAEAPQAQGAMEALQVEFEPRQREIVALQTAYQDKQAQIQRDLEVMGPEERRNAEVDLRKDERELQRAQEEFQEDFNLRRNEELSQLQRELLREVQTYARTANYDLIVGEGVLFASDGVNVTDAVLAALLDSYQKSSGSN